MTRRICQAAPTGRWQRGSTGDLPAFCPPLPTGRALCRWRYEGGTVPVGPAFCPRAQPTGPAVKRANFMQVCQRKSQIC
jgi:hypothetical protein